jgi:hypothetical protein
MASGRGVLRYGAPAGDRGARTASLDPWLDDLDDLDDVHGRLTAETTADARRWWAAARPANGAQRDLVERSRRGRLLKSQLPSGRGTGASSVMTCMRRRRALAPWSSPGSIYFSLSPAFGQYVACRAFW